MSESNNSIKWDQKNGIITLIRNAKEERIVLMRKGFVEAFFDEIAEVEGKNTLTMTFRNLLKELGASDEFLEKPDYDTFKRFQDGYILPLSMEKESIPGVFKWDGKGREFTAFGDTVFNLQTLRFFQSFKKVMADILTEKGAVAILHSVARRGGMAVGERACANYGWKELDAAMSSMDEALSFIFPFLGWGKTRVVTKKDPNGYYMLYLKCWNSYESHNISSPKPVCTVFQRYLEGIGEHIASTLSGKSTESREVKCLAKGDDYCGFAIKQKDKGKGSLDWNALEGEWKELDGLGINPHG